MKVKLRDLKLSEINQNKIYLPYLKNVNFNDVHIVVKENKREYWINNINGYLVSLPKEWFEKAKDIVDKLEETI